MLSDSSQIIFLKITQVQCQGVFVIVAVIVFLFLCVPHCSVFTFWCWCFFMKMFSIMQQGALFTKKDRIHEENSGYFLLLECNF